MSVNRRLLDDVSRLATSAAGLVQGAGKEAETLVRQRLERLLDGMDLVTREEFDAVKAMAAKARSENAALNKRLVAMEEVIQSLNAKSKPKAAAAAKPKAAAKAVAMFDCWMQEQEENNQPPDIAACRKAFNIAKLDIKTRPKAKMAKPMMKKAAPRAPMPAPYVVYFGFDSAEVSGSEMVKIKQAYADYRLRNPGKILVAGHTDTSGNKEYNQGLSRYRAAEVSNRLMELGVPRKMVQRSRHGEVAPVVETGDNAREGKNRRVTITFIR